MGFETLKTDGLLSVGRRKDTDLEIGVMPMGFIRAGVSETAGRVFEKRLSQANELGRNLVGSRKKGAVNPDTEDVRKSFGERMRRLVL